MQDIELLKANLDKKADEMRKNTIEVLKANLHKQVDALHPNTFDFVFDPNYNLIQMINVFNAASDFKDDYYFPIMMDIITNAINDSVAYDESGKEEFMYTNSYISDRIYYFTGLCRFLCKIAANAGI